LDIKNKKAKILACDDDENILEAVKTILLAEGYDVKTANNGKEAIEVFKKDTPDLIILDVSMPGMSGFAVLDRIKPYFGNKYTPVIFMTASIKVDHKLRALHGGAVDYLIKPVSPEELIARIKNFLELKKKHDELKEEATFDWMTGVLNKAYFLRQAGEEIEKSLRNNFPVAFMLTDIDGLKKINDTFGHLAGDRVIREFANRLKRFVRRIDLIGRFGGDEFMVMLSHKNESQAGMIAERLAKNMGKPVDFEGNRINVTFSAGIARTKNGEETGINALLKRADEALYDAKSKGGNRYTLI